MVLSIDKDNAFINVSSSAKPDVKLRNELNTHTAFWNETIGFNPDETRLASCFTFTGTVPISGSAADRAGWTFGFIQFMRVLQMRATWNGRIASEGSITLILDTLLGGKEMLDCVPGRRGPFFTQASPAPASGDVSVSMGDHPFLKLADEIPNNRTGKPNFLFGVVDIRRATSIFAARDPAGKLIPLGSVQFNVRYDTVLKWVNEKPSLAGNGSTFSVGDFTLDLPSNIPAKQFSSVNENSPLANDLSVTAMKTEANFSVNDRQTAGVPDNFFN